MDITTIVQLRGFRDSIRESLKQIKAADYHDRKYGQEHEYTAKGLIGGVDALVTDLAALLKNPTRFVQFTNYTERQNLVNQFSNLNSYVSSKDLASIAATVDQIKSMMRGFGIRNSTERKEEFLNHVDDMQRKCIELTSYLDELKAIKEKSESVSSEIDKQYEEISTAQTNLAAKTEEIDSLLDQVDETRKSSKNLLSVDKENSDEIQELLSESKSHKELIDSFAKRIEAREAQLDNQEEKTKKYLATLDGFAQQHGAHLKKANDLIESAKLALEYKTAEGLSAAFAAKYDELKKDKSSIGWIVAAGVFIALAISVGVWIVWEKNLSLETIIGRLSLLPILLGATWFCAGQYIKLRNLAEDYAYKSVLAKSMVGFSEQLSSASAKNEEYSHYIKSVLYEMHNDPLGRRKNGSASNSSGADNNEVIEKLMSVVELLKNKIPSADK